MNDRDQKMMTEIGKVIMNILDSEGGITLPSIGVIKRVDESYELAEDGEYTSLVDALEGMSGVSRNQAEALYDRWLDMVQMEDGLFMIDRIGTIKGGELIVEKKLFSKLNDSKPTPEVVAKEPTPKRKSGGNPLPYVIAAVVVVGLAIYGFFAVGNIEREEVETVTVVEQVVEIAEVEQVTEVVKPEPIVAPKPVAKPIEELYLEKGEQPRLRTYRGRTISDDEALAVLEKTVERSSEAASKRYQVALGVYTYGSNIGRLIVDFEKFLGDRAVPTYVVEYGKSRVVSLFGSDSMAECEQFISQVGSKLTGNLWVCRVK